MKIQPLGNNIQLELEEAKAGILDTSSRDSAVEFATVVAIPNDNASTNLNESFGLKVGDTVFVKAFGVDIITHQDKRYYFCNPATGAILAKVS